MGLAVSERLLRVGYWYEVGPRMELGGRMGRGPGLDPRDFVDPSWDPLERSRVARHLSAGRVLASYRGMSWCRMGCAPGSGMGSRDLTDGVYVWPEGYVHYLLLHAVRPPAEFVRHVLERSQARA